MKLNPIILALITLLVAFLPSCTVMSRDQVQGRQQRRPMPYPHQQQYANGHYDEGDMPEPMMRHQDRRPSELLAAREAQSQSSGPRLSGAHVVKRNKRTGEVIEDLGWLPVENNPYLKDPKSKVRGPQEALYFNVNEKGKTLRGAAPSHLSKDTMDQILRARQAGGSAPTNPYSRPGDAPLDIALEREDSGAGPE